MIRARRLTFMLLVVLLLPTAAAAGEPATLLKNINQLPDYGLINSPPAGIVGSGPTAVIGTRVFFVYRDPRNGAELWSSDGTSAGTALVRDIQPGPEDGRITSMVAVGSTLFFVARDADLGSTLWRSDGTPAGTQIVRPDTGDLLEDLHEPGALTVSGSLVYFVNRDAYVNRSLWRSDGTPEGTYKLRYITGFDGANMIGTLGNSFFFMMQSGASGQLWKTDGSIAGTELVQTVGGLSAGRRGATLNGALYFFTNGPSGLDLWRSGGTAATTTVVHALASAGDPVAAGNWLFFSGTDPLQPSQRALWRSDGTAPGTTVLESFGSSPAALTGLTAVGDTLFFAGEGGRVSVTDGGAVTELTAATAGNGLYTTSFTQLGSAVYFVARLGGLAYLWRTDGTAAGTAQVSGQLALSTDGPAWIASIGDALLFAASNRIWRSDGTPAGTLAVQAAEVIEYGLSGAAQTLANTQLLRVGEALFFVADDGVHGEELWTSNGTTDTTRMVVDLRIGQAGSVPRGLREFGGRLVFFANDGRGFGLWESDGTEAGTRLIRLISQYGVSMVAATLFDQKLYFTATDSLVAGFPVNSTWVSDGTEGGTHSLAGVGGATEMAVSGGRLFLQIGGRLWASDGTAAGTHQLTGSDPVQPFSMTDLNGVLYFYVELSPFQKLQLWKSDGSVAGTGVVKDFNITNGRATAEPGDFTVAGNTLYFTLTTFAAGAELWASDGTGQGTRLVRDLNLRSSTPGRTESSAPAGLVALGDRVLFSADDRASGRELWSSDGTEAGTALVKDIAAGAIGSYPAFMGLAGDSLIFAASDGPSGVEVWQTDGTGPGTRLLTEIAAGPGSSNPSGFTMLGERLYAIADNGLTGQELWSISRADPPPEEPETPSDYRAALPLVVAP